MVPTNFETCVAKETDEPGVFTERGGVKFRRQQHVRRSTLTQNVRLLIGGQGLSFFGAEHTLVVVSPIWRNAFITNR